MNTTQLVKTQFADCPLVVEIEHPYGAGKQQFFDIGDKEYFGVLSTQAGAQVFHKNYSHFAVTRFLDQYLETGKVVTVRRTPRRRGHSEAQPRKRPPVRKENKAPQRRMPSNFSSEGLQKLTRTTLPRKR